MGTYGWICQTTSWANRLRGIQPECTGLDQLAMTVFPGGSMHSSHVSGSTRGGADPEVTEVGEGFEPSFPEVGARPCFASWAFPPPSAFSPADYVAPRPSSPSRYPSAEMGSSGTYGWLPSIGG